MQMATQIATIIESTTIMPGIIPAGEGGGEGEPCAVTSDQHEEAVDRR
jgi:hypothetical protein